MRHRAADFIQMYALQVVTFIDLAGHEKYLKTTVFGMTGHAPDFSMLMVSFCFVIFVFKSCCV